MRACVRAAFGSPVGVLEGACGLRLSSGCVHSTPHTHTCKHTFSFRLSPPVVCGPASPMCAQAPSPARPRPGPAVCIGHPAYNHHALVPRLDKRGFSTGQPLLQGTSRAFHTAIYAAAGYNGITPHGERGDHEGMKAGSHCCSGRNLPVSVVFGLSHTRPWITLDLGLVQFAPCAARNRDFFRSVLALSDGFPQARGTYNTSRAGWVADLACRPAAPTGPTHLAGATRPHRPRVGFRYAL